MRHLQRGQVMSSFVAVAAAVAVVIGLLVLFGTRDPGTSNAGPPNSPSPSSSAPSSSTPTSPATQPPVPTRPTTVAPSTRPSTPPATVKPTTTPSRSPSRTPEETEPAARAPVEIYNNTTRRGLADRVAQRARAQGWQVAGIDNWQGRVITTTVYYPDGMRAAAQALAGDLGIGSTKPALSNMKRDRLTVILTKDYSE